MSKLEYSKFIVNKYLGYFGLSLIISPMYFYLVNIYQPEVYRLWFIVMQNSAIGRISAIMILLGINLVLVNLSNEVKKKNKFIYKVSIINICLILAFSTWIYLGKLEAYFGVVFFIICITFLLESLVLLYKNIIAVYQKLEAYEKLTITIPIITILMNFILR